MKVTFEITGCQPITTNASHRTIVRKGAKHASIIKSLPYKQFQSVFNSKMRVQRVNVNKLNKYFDEKIHCLQIDYKFFCPILTKKGTLIKRSKDVDNMVKPTQDTLFTNFLFDDSFITKITAEKLHSETPRIEITVKVLTFDVN